MFAHFIKRPCPPYFYNLDEGSVFFPNISQEINEKTLADRKIFEPLSLFADQYNLPIKAALDLDKNQYALVWKKGRANFEIFRFKNNDDI